MESATSRGHANARHRRLICVVGCVAILVGASPLRAQDEGEADAPASRFKDPDDGRFDVSGFLDTAYGFVPLLVPITEPAVGYGAVGAAVFIHGGPPAPGEQFVRPTMSAVGALRTENGTRGWFGANLGTWWNGRLRTIAALGDIDLNLEYFGLGDRVADGLGYSVKAKGGVLGGNYRLADTQLWLGVRYASVDTDVALDAPLTDLPNVQPADYGLRLAALTPSITFDRRDNFFTPTRGIYVDLSLPMYRDSFGSDRDFETANHGDVLPAARRFALFRRARQRQGQLRRHAVLSAAVRRAARRAGVAVSRRTSRGARGGSALAAQAALQRRGFRRRWRSAQLVSRERSENITAGGAGFRYLIARRYGMQMGIDVADGPDDTVLYVVFGNAWLRP